MASLSFTPQLRIVSPAEALETLKDARRIGVVLGDLPVIRTTREYAREWLGWLQTEKVETVGIIWHHEHMVGWCLHLVPNPKV